MEKIKLLITDDHRILVDGLKKLFDNSETVLVIGTAYSGKECKNFLIHDVPDVILLDINLPDVSGIELCREIKIKYPSVKIVALTSYNEYTIVRQMLENGANGYVLKNAMPEEILLSVEKAIENDRFLCEEIDILMKKRSQNQIWLTPREKELLKLIVEGNTNIEIADKMYLGVETINSYRKNLLLKLNAKNTAVLVRMALEEKLM